MSTISIRHAQRHDAARLHRLALLDGAAHAPPGAVLLAEVDGRLAAAVSISDGTVVADPFKRTATVVAMLRLGAGLS
jgi:hypothetical protein